MIRETSLLENPVNTWRYKIHSFVVFVLTFLAYSLFHANRKTFSNLKSTISEEWAPSFHNKTVSEVQPDTIWNRHTFYGSFKASEFFLGTLDTTFLTSYAIGLYISGVIGDRVPLRYVLTFGMCGAACTVFIFGVVTEWLQFYNTAFYICVWIVNGLLQSSGWPTVVAVMGNWFGKSSRGLVLGVWSACASVGNIIGAALVAEVLNYGYDYAFLVNSVILFCGGVIIFFGLVESPRELGYPVADEMNFEVDVPDDTCNPDSSLGSAAINISSTSTVDSTRSVERPKAITFVQAILLPGVIMYSLSYACLKLVNYSLFFWLPYYLKAAFKWEETVADDISIWYDVGGIGGGAVIGFLSDRLGKRAIVIIPALTAAIPALFFFSHTTNSLVQNAGMLALVGLFIGGVANIISAAVSADLGRQKCVAESEEALATVTGIVDGTGSVGAAAGQLIVPWVERQYGWHPVFYVFIVSTFLTEVCIVPMFVRETRSICGHKKCISTPEETRSLLDHEHEQYPRPYSELTHKSAVHGNIEDPPQQVHSHKDVIN